MRREQERATARALDTLRDTLDDTNSRTAQRFREDVLRAEVTTRNDEIEALSVSFSRTRIDFLRRYVVSVYLRTQQQQKTKTTKHRSRNFKASGRKRVTRNCQTREYNWKT